MKLNPLGYLDIPAGWPKKGHIGAREVDLKEAWQTMSHAGIASIEVDVPGRGRIAPWSNLDGLDDFELAEDAGGLAREDLESNGVFDSTLEAWARDKYGLTIDLSKDDGDTQAIRRDAYARFLAETEW